MYYTTNKATSLYNIANADDVATILSSTIVQLPQGLELQSANDPPKALFGYVAVIGTLNGKGLAGYVAYDDVTQEMFSKTTKLGIGIAAVAFGWLFFFKKH